LITVNATKTHIAPKKTVNPFAQMIEDKMRIDRAVEEGKSPSTLKGINFVKPLQDHPKK
jgi:hypothetical protein